MSKFTPQYTYDTFEYNNVQNTTTIGYTLTLPNLLLLNSIFIKIFYDFLWSKYFTSFSSSNLNRKATPRNIIRPTQPPTNI